VLTGKPWSRRHFDAALPQIAEDYNRSATCARRRYRLQVAVTLLTVYLEHTGAARLPASRLARTAVT